MSKEPSLLNQIKSKYILQKIFSFAFKDTKSVFKFIKYDKKLIKNLEINIKDSFEYKTSKNIYKDKNISCFHVFIVMYEINAFILYLIYIILFYTKGKFNEKNLKEKYDKKNKNCVDIMDNYILISYFVFIIISFLCCFIMYIFKYIIMKRIVKIIIIKIIGLVDFI